MNCAGGTVWIFVALAVAGVAMDADQEAPVAPLFLAPAANRPRMTDPCASRGSRPARIWLAGRLIETGESRLGHRPQQLEAAAQDLDQRFEIPSHGALKLRRSLDRDPEAHRETPPAARRAAVRAVPSTARSQAGSGSHGRPAHRAARRDCRSPARPRSSLARWRPDRDGRDPAASLGSRFRSIVMERVRRPSASPSSKNAYGRAPKTACERGEGAVRSRHSTCTEPSSILPRSARKPSTSMVSCRQSSMVCFTSG